MAPWEKIFYCTLEYEHALDEQTVALEEREKERERDLPDMVAGMRKIDCSMNRLLTNRLAS